MLKLLTMAMSLLLLPLMTYSWNIIAIMLILFTMYSSTLMLNPLNIPMFFSKMFMIDSLSAPLITLTLWITFLMITASQNTKTSNNSPAMFLTMVLLLNSILIITFSMNNMINFYILFESSLIPTLLLVLGWGYQPERLQAGMYLMLYTIAASLPLLISMLWMYQKNLHLSMSLLTWSTPVQSAIPLWWFMTIMAFMVKMPLFITHLWLPKAHVEAPVAGSMVLAAILLKLGSYGILRAASALVWLNSALSPMISSIAMWGACVTGAICTRQTDMKSLIAYSSVGHMALLIAGTMSTTQWGWSGSLSLMMAHGLCSSAMFALANMTYESTQTRSMYMTKGMLNLFPAMTFMWFIMSAANMAAPPSINLLSEILLMTSALSISLIYMTPVGITAFLAAAYSLILYTSSQHGSPPAFANSLNLLNPRNYFIILTHFIPIILIIMSPEYITTWI